METREIIYFEELDSTNTEIHRMALQGAADGTVVIAKRQTAGKGRRGRIWDSHAEENLYMSFLLRPKMEVAKAPMLTLVMAYSLARELRRQSSVNVQIKWPNDLIASGKKLCGILTELHLEKDAVDHVIIGVGINVNVAAFSDELEDKATSMYLESGALYDLQSLAKEIVASFANDYEIFLQHQDLAYVQKEYNELLVNCGKEVRVLEPEREYEARALGINRGGELVVEKADGTLEAIYAGEVSVRGIYGYV